MNWINIDSSDKINEVKEISGSQKVMIFKYSPKCAINYIVRNLLEREWNGSEMLMKTYLVDVVSNKELSQKIEGEFGVSHESPQVLIIENSKPVFTASHGKILYSEIRKFAN